MLEVKLLGQFDVRQDGKPVEIGTRPAQSLLAFLILKPGTAFRREKLAGLLWPDATEANARNNLRNALWRLRQALGTGPPSGRDYFLADNFTIAFDASAEYELDVAALEGSPAQDAAGKDAATDGAAADALIAGVSAYQGELLPGFYDEWAALERERLQAVFEHKMGLLLEQLVAAERWAEARDWGERWIALGGAPEPAYRALMITHGALGDVSRVAAVYARGVEALREQLGVEPSEQTRQLYVRLSKGSRLSGNAASAATVQAPAPIAAPVDAPAPGTPPFKGLQHFDQADAGIFFGREQLTARLVSHLGQHRFLAVVGASGSGKSSVVRAGLVPALRQARAGPEIGVTIVTPTAHPLEALAVAMTLDSESVTAATTLMDDLAREPRSLHLAALRIASRPGGGRRLLVVDQFEELFTLCRAETERAAFVDNLLTAVEGDCPLSVVITLRADFYAHCGPYPRLRDALERDQAYIGPMSTDELRQAIEGPARLGGWELEAGLVQLLLHDVSGEPGALPLLSHALLETWQRRRGRTLTLGGYAASGGVRGAIAMTAESVYQHLSSEQQAIARGIFLRLTELGEGTQDTRRRAALAEIFPGADDGAARREATELVLKTLADARLITITETTVEVAHEALIREWPALREWLNENREALRLHHHLTEAAQAWDKLGRDPGELYRGARLAQALERTRWAEGQLDALNVLEREFLLTSQELAEREAAEREAQRQRELQAAQVLAQAERQRAEEQARAAGRLRTRNRIVTLFGAAALVLSLAALFFAFQVRQQARLADSRRLAIQALGHTRDQFELSALLSLEALNLANTVEARGALLAGLQAHPNLLRQLRGTGWPVNKVAYSPNGKFLAAGYADGSIGLWDVASGQRVTLRLIGHVAQITDVAFSPDGQSLASSSSDSTIQLWDAVTGRPLGQPLSEDGQAVYAVAFSPDGKTLATGTLNLTVVLWDVETRRQIGSMGEPVGSAPNDSLDRLAFAPDGQTLAAGGDHGYLVLWDVATRQPLGQRLPGHSGAIFGLAFSPDGKTLASGGDDDRVILWDVTTRQPVGPSLSGQAGGVFTVAFSPDGRALAFAGADHKVRLVNAATLRPIGLPFANHTDTVSGVVFSPDGQILASGDDGGNILLWDVAARLSLLADAGSVNSVALSPDGKTLAAGTFGGQLVLWNAATRQLLGPPLGGSTAPINSVAFSPDGKTVATAADDQTLILWDVAARAARGMPLSGHTGAVESVAFSPDGRTLASGSADHTIRLWDTTTRQALGPPLTGHIGAVNSVAFSPDGQTLASGSTDRTIRLWDVAKRQAIGAPLTGHVGPVTSVAFSPDGKLLVSGSLDNRLILWDVANKIPSGPALTGHIDWVYGVAFSPDGQTVASASRDGTVRLWDVATRQALGQAFTGHTGGVNSVAISPDGKTLASGSNDTRVLLWDIDPASWRAHACTLVGRNLTQAEWAQYLPGQSYQQTCAQ